MCINKSADLCEIAKILSGKCADSSKSVAIFTLPCLMKGVLNSI